MFKTKLASLTPPMNPRHRLRVFDSQSRRSSLPLMKAPPPGFAEAGSETRRRDVSRAIASLIGLPRLPPKDSIGPRPSVSWAGYTHQGKARPGRPRSSPCEGALTVAVLHVFQGVG